MTEQPPCPVCAAPALTKHCPQTITCTWETCTRCKSNIDRARDRHDHGSHVDNCTACGPVVRRARR